jgi:hypothetical protein
VTSWCRASVVSVGWLCACGRSPGSVSGTIHGQPFTIADAVSAIVPATTGGLSNGAMVVMADTPALCADFSASSEPKYMHLVSIYLVPPPTTVDTFAILTGPNVGSLLTFTTDASCRSGPADSAAATGGTITLTSVNGEIFAGHFDVALDSGDRITGSFNPEACAGVRNFVDPAMSLTCK